MKVTHLFLSALAIAGAAFATAQHDPSKTMIVVNGSPIKADVYYRRMEILPNVGRNNNGRYQPATPGFLTLQTLINEILLVQLAAERKVTPTAAEIQEEYDAKLHDAPEIPQILKAAGVSEADYRNDLMIQLCEFKIITQGINITDQEVESYYKTNLPNYTVPKRWKVRVIVVTSDAKMKQVDDELRAGKAFSAVATAMSEDVTKVDGGLLGEVTEEQMGPAVKEPLLALQKGQTSGWIKGEGETRVKYLIDDILPSSVFPLDKYLARQIRRTLMTDRGRNRNNIFKLMADFRKKARIEYQGTPFDKQIKQALESS